MITVEAVCSRSQEEGHRYKTIVTNMMFREDQPPLVAFRDFLIECGFVVAGCLKEAADKDVSRIRVCKRHIKID